MRRMEQSHPTKSRQRTSNTRGNALRRAEVTVSSDRLTANLLRLQYSMYNAIICIYGANKIKEVSLLLIAQFVLSAWTDSRCGLLDLTTVPSKTRFSPLSSYRWV